MKSLDETARDFVGLFEQLGVSYAVMGGMAVRIHGLPRPTFDVDFTAIMPRSDLPDLYRAAAKRGFTIPPAQSTGWIDLVGGLPVVKFQWFLGDRSIDIDVFLAETPFQRQLLERRRRYGAEGWEAWFVTAEDLILLKLLADRPKDRADVADILFIQGQLDMPYLRAWAEKLGIADALETALTELRN